MSVGQWTALLALVATIVGGGWFLSSEIQRNSSETKAALALADDVEEDTKEDLFEIRAEFQRLKSDVDSDLKVVSDIGSQVSALKQVVDFMRGEIRDVELDLREATAGTGSDSAVDRVERSETRDEDRSEQNIEGSVLRNLNRLETAVEKLSGRVGSIETQLAQLKAASITTADVADLVEERLQLFVRYDDKLLIRNLEGSEASPRDLYLWAMDQAKPNEVQIDPLNRTSTDNFQRSVWVIESAIGN